VVQFLGSIIRIGVYTLNTEEEMRKFIDMKVDTIITDYPGRLINILQESVPVIPGRF
jgi:glycerophosphoryl diester phosphodiesterase